MSKKRNRPSESSFEEASQGDSSGGTAVAELPSAPPPAVVEQAKAPAAPNEKSQPTGPDHSEWDRIAHVWDWFAVYFWIGCVAFIWVLHFIDLVQIPFAR